MPVTAVVARTAANVKAGASSRLAVGLSGVWAAALLLWGGAVLQHLPITCLAAVFVVLAAELMPLAALQAAHRRGRLWSYVSTLVASVRLNVLVGVALGLVVAVAERAQRRPRG